MDLSDFRCAVFKVREIGWSRPIQNQLCVGEGVGVFFLYINVILDSILCPSCLLFLFFFPFWFHRRQEAIFHIAADNQSFQQWSTANHFICFVC